MQRPRVGSCLFTRAIAAEGAAHGIRANAISPGFVKTPATDSTVDGTLSDFVMNLNLIRRTGTPDDIAYLTVYLASDESSWVTGQNVSMDGGVTAGYRSRGIRADAPWLPLPEWALSMGCQGFKVFQAWLLIATAGCNRHPRRGSIRRGARCLVTLMLAPAVTVVGSEAQVAKTPPP
jgi:hypothetical protein